MKLLFSLIIILLVASSNAYAGGSDGSELLGEIKQEETNNKGLMDRLKKMFRKENRRPTITVVQDDNKIFDEEILLDCFVTPAIASDHIPLKTIKNSNNLIRKIGAARRAQGQYIQIYGKVMDEDCLPISGAVVQIWQTDSAGKYEDAYTLKSEWDIRDKSYDKNFNYSGTAQTNNVGEFNFVSILPGMKDKNLAPHINMSIKHPDFKEVTTMMFFNKHPRNGRDPNLQNLAEDKRALVIAKSTKLDPTGKFEGRIYKFPITLEGMNMYRRY